MRRSGSSSRSYPLAGGSRSRRRLLTNQNGGVVEESASPVIDWEEPALAGEVGDSAPVVEPPQVHVSPTPGLSGIRAISRLLGGSKPVTWVFTGDSVTHGAKYTQGRRSFTEHFAERVRWELRRFLDVVINTGVAGERSGGLLKNLDWRAARFRPDVVSVMIGLNDATLGQQGREIFRDNLQQIVTHLRDKGALVLLNTPNHINFNGAGTHADLRAYVKIIRETVLNLDVACVDHWAHWKRAKPTEKDLRPWLADDGIHPGVYGHREMAKLIFERLGIFDEKSPTCAARVP